jgi:putative oxidoreductase
MHDGVGGFGDFLNSQGFYIGFYLTWGITLFEIVGSILIMVNYFTFWISIIFILELSTGIVLVHASNGWFVVGGGTGGMEYSVLLILCYILLAATAKASSKA